MSVSDERLLEFIELYQKEFGEELSLAEARAMTGELLAFYRIICRPLPEGYEGEDANEG